ncbi:DUF4465 domain-containing protein [Flavilitoribacter nigricans]|uniref:PEP-CTERM sorting domain-containing protein n=1 Tax=Flavilitoribacter nigricans (strain ATCC 23147 / DSM 23189 / NBRC 102662 / NCIMB 1420 / SS-2) TaxID=1122177 RepID=A0A2D0N4V9_FLAN2|nr:DUF4465 domain-containing protein [Flavilitoribacter nigricans]PHN03551.1 PEP-CTERM sorting domain-containing protein [Flavilitoribacter nigricans DSM 23189 = NBRC 102662]
MRQFFICLLGSISLSFVSAQTTATFESFGLAPDNFLDGGDNSGGFSDGNVFLPNSYNFDYGSWSGWAISSMTDTLTAGYTNQFSAITGGGYDDSDTYAVTFASPFSNLILTEGAAGGTVEGLYVTNNTYAYLSMLNGDSFAKKFGGETGDDPDFFLLTIKKYLNGTLSTDSIDFYLADYRFEDNSQDYIVKEWTYLDLTALGDADSLQFSLTSSDVGQYGPNTPAYLCLDQITTLDVATPVKDYLTDVAVRIFPNPTAEQVTVHWPQHQTGNALLLDAQGQIIKREQLFSGDNQIGMQELPAGPYRIRIQSEDGFLTRQIIKQ